MSHSTYKMAAGIAVLLVLSGALYLLSVRGTALLLDLSALVGMLCF